MNFLLSPDGSLLLVVLTIVAAIAIAFGILRLIDTSCGTLERFGLIGNGLPQATQAIAEKLLEVARCVSFDDEINSLDLESVMQCLEEELPAKSGLQKRPKTPSMSSLPVELPETVANFCQEWGVLEGIGWSEFCLRADYVTGCGHGVFVIGVSEVSSAFVVVSSKVVFEREGYGKTEWEVTPVAKTIYHFALKLCREQPDEE